QIFDINHLYTDAYSGRYVLEKQEYFDRLSLEGWYNYTRFDGDNLRTGKRAQIPLIELSQFNGFTDASIISPGFRNAITWGEDKHPQVTAGVDLRYLSQHLNEFDFFQRVARTNFPIPQSHSIDPGVFADGVLPLGDRWTLKAGVRVDWVSTDVDSLPTGGNIPPPGPGPSPPSLYGTTKLNEDYNLWAAFISSEYKLSDHWSMQAGFGNALRPPTLTELYAAGPFLAIVQNGANNVYGNPNLSPEELR